MSFTKVLDMHVHAMHNARMLLDAYLSNAGMTDAAFAEKIGKSRSMVTKLRQRKTKPSFDTALEIEKATDGKVALKDLEPVSDNDAPAVAAQ